MTSFEQWARSTSTATRRCKVCALPDEVYAQVVAARAQGYGSIVVSKFLADLGYAVSASSLDNHFSKGGGHGR